MIGVSSDGFVIRPIEANRSDNVKTFGSVLTGGTGLGSNCVDDVLARSRVIAALDFERRLDDDVVVVLRGDLTVCCCCCWRCAARASV